MRTSKEDVFAAGDCCIVKYNPAKDTRYIPLATNAVRMGTLVAKNIVKPTLKYMGTQGTSGIKIYQQCIASTGLTEEMAKNTTSMNVDSVTIMIIIDQNLCQHLKKLKLSLYLIKTLEE